VTGSRSRMGSRMRSRMWKRKRRWSEH